MFSSGVWLPGGATKFDGALIGFVLVVRCQVWQWLVLVEEWCE